MHRLICGITILFCLVSFPSAYSQTVDAKQVITDAMNYAKALGSLSVEMTVNQKVNMAGTDRSVEVKGSLMMRGGKDMYLHIGTPANEADFFCNAQKQVVHLISEKQYLEKPSTRKELMSLVGGGLINMGFMWLAKFLHGDDSFLTSASTVEYVGLEQPNGENTPKQHRLKMKTTVYEMDVWFLEGATPFPQHFILSASQGMGAMSSATSEFVFSQWQANPSIPDERFAFTPPEGVTPMEPTGMPGGKDPMIGKPAPPLTLDIMGGGKLDLANLKGKNVVILDFFATWCGPCRMAMPLVAEVAKQYENKGVLLYAVNLGEPEEKIKAFLDKAQINVTVALDKDKKAGMDYHASSIPRMVIVDKEGIVREAHNGLSPTFKEDLPKELDAILAGKAPEEAK